MKTVQRIILTLLLSELFLPLHAQDSATFYSIVARYSLPGDAGWDYLVADSVSGRLFVSHGTMVQVADQSTGTLLGTIPDTKGVHGIALAHAMGKGFISCGRDSSVVVFDLATLKTLARVKVTGRNPDAILFDGYSGKVFTCNGGSSDMTVIDAASGHVLSTIPLPGKPEFSVSDGAGKIFVNIEDKSQIVCINSKSLEMEQQWSIAPGESPSGLAFDRTHHRLFSVCENELMIVVNSLTGGIVTTLPIGRGTDGAAFDPLLQRVYSSNGEGTLTVVQETGPDTFSVLTTITTQRGARTITVNPRTHHIFLPTAEYGPAPQATPATPHPRPGIKPGTFVVLEIVPLK
jgi:DNA-binding beta-propeller fold protein YncE